MWLNDGRLFSLQRQSWTSLGFQCFKTENPTPPPTHTHNSTFCHKHNIAACIHSIFTVWSLFLGRWNTVSTCVTGWWSISSLPPPMRRGNQINPRVHVALSLESVVICSSSCFTRLILRELGPWACHMRWLVWVMASFGTTYVFFFHERWVYVPRLW